MKKRNLLSLFAVAAALLILSSCGAKSSYYQKQEAIPGAQWNYKFQPVFKVDISDVKAQYRFYLLIRHDESYPYANFWFRMNVKGPAEKTFKDGTRIQKDLADPKGEWLGRGMGGIWEHKIALSPNEIPRFNKPGTYEIRIEQVMRDNPLPSVLNVGLIIEKL